MLGIQATDSDCLGDAMVWTWKDTISGSAAENMPASVDVFLTDPPTVFVKHVTAAVGDCAVVVSDIQLEVNGVPFPSTNDSSGALLTIKEDANSLKLNLFFDMRKSYLTIAPGPQSSVTTGTYKLFLTASIKDGRTNRQVSS